MSKDSIDMVVIRPTASLAKRMKVKLQSSNKKSTTILGDWFANDFVLNRKQFILCMSSTSRLCVVMHAAPYAKFPIRLENEVYILLRALGLEKHIVEKETDKMKDFSLAKTNDRSILGSMNDFKNHLEAHSHLGRLDLNEPQKMSLMLSKVITLTLEEGYPCERALKLLGSQPNNVLDFKRPNS